MNIKEAVLKILKESGGALHSNEITKRILDSELWVSVGKTPEATVSAFIYSDIKKNGNTSNFMKVAPKVFALRSSPVSAVDAKLILKTENTFIQCAQKVLTMANTLMHYRNITEEALKKGWLLTGGKTPSSSMYTQIITEINRKRRRGETPLFVQHGRGYFGLSKWIEHGPESQIKQHNQRVAKELGKFLFSMSPDDFEELIAQLMVAMGFEETEVTNRSRDGGIDVRGTLIVGDVICIKMAVQVKRWKKNIQAPIVQNVRGSLNAHEHGLIITTSDFSSGAKKDAQQPDKNPIAIMNGKELVKLLMEHRIGVRCSTQDLFNIAEKDFGA